MNKRQRYLIAKYAPDLNRMEPRNIGVILWSAGNTSARFLPEDDAKLFVNELSVYRRWTAYWKRLINQDEIAINGRKPVSRDNPKFIRHLLDTQKGNYLLSDGGIVTDRIRPSEQTAATDFLFDELVTNRRQRAEKIEHERLAAIAEEVIDAAGVRDREGYRASFELPCTVWGVEQELKFDYGLFGDSSPQALFLRVALARQQSVTSGAFKFECVVEKDRMLDKSKCVALVFSPEEPSKHVASHRMMLDRTATVIDLANTHDAIEQIKRVAA